MQMNNLKRNTKRKFSQSVGRGGKRGKTSGRGTKGQKARAGRKIRPEMRDNIMRLPKLRGYRFKSFKAKPAIVRLETIEKFFSAGDAVNPETLKEKKIIFLAAGKMPGIKILSDGHLSKKISFSGVLVSGKARAKIEAAGGSITL